jgi:TetR/AcrR family transcriptional regulator, transcriptional repressor for nem operon
MNWVRWLSFSHQPSFPVWVVDVGIRAASVHYHFPQKALLGTAVVDRYTGKIMAAIGP